MIFHLEIYNNSRTKFIPIALRFVYVISLAKPRPLINLVGLISMSNYNILAIHIPLLPSLSNCNKILFIATSNTYDITWICKIKTPKYVSDLINTYDYLSRILYFSSTSLNALLRKEMGCSWLASFFWSITPEMVCLEAKEKIMKSFGKIWTNK